MIKILHSADWHLDAPIVGRSSEQTAFLKEALRKVPQKVAAAAAGCDVMLLAGDLFDGPYTRQSLDAVRGALEDAGIPVFIAPGNHDYAGANSPYLTEHWPQNVHIFTTGTLESVALPALDLRIYGAGFTAPDAPGLLEGFRAQCEESYAVCVLHGDPTVAASPYCPVTAQQVQQSGLAYLALGHIHKGGTFQAGDTLCAWPGCPMGHGFDECDTKGVLRATLGEKVQAQFLPLDTPRFYDLSCAAGGDAAAAVAGLLPGAGSRDFYRITLTGESSGVDTAALLKDFSHVPNLILRDRTVLPVDLWATAGEDTLEGVYFGMLCKGLEGADEETAARIRLAAKLSRQLLQGQEVTLP